MNKPPVPPLNTYRVLQCKPLSCKKLRKWRSALWPEQNYILFCYHYKTPLLC